jgi:hypothetical protein
MGCHQSHAVVETEIMSVDSTADAESPQSPTVKRACSKFDLEVPPADDAETTAPASEMDVVNVKLAKAEGGAFGFRIADDGEEDGLIITVINDNSLLTLWNQQNPHLSAVVGDRILQVNGVTGTWAIMEEMWKCSAIDMMVLRNPEGSHRIASQCHVTDKMMENTRFVLARTVFAGDVHLDTCAICIQSVEPGARFAHLDCGHGFHQRCIVRWMGHREEALCPLCRCAVH